jgi:hypothetical protein
MAHAGAERTEPSEFILPRRVRGVKEADAAAVQPAALLTKVIGNPLKRGKPNMPVPGLTMARTRRSGARSGQKTLAES